ncbi:MAG: RNA methyltransferase [Clostridia bacterium]|jgi:TrmH family RNA methyltransferase|nr:RNA methyltransferase [Clostridia bacterium]MDD3862243.1 RNA methyltransferase [Clostridia bacterium]MDD4408373.1 RNA methyltransferase [Clostridia bacterium]
MSIIKSLQNPYIKMLKKQMKQKNLLFLDSPKLIEEAFKSDLKLHTLLIDYKKTKSLEKFYFIKNSENKIVTTTSEIIKHFSDVKAPQGIIGIFELQKTSLKTPNGNFLVLDCIQDAGNVGTLLRSALGAGFKDVYLLNCAQISNMKTVRSSMGAIFKLNVYQTTKAEFLEFFKNISYPLYSADLGGKNIFDFKFKIPCGIALGNEGSGLSHEIKGLSVDTISIPIDANLESLNVGVAGSIIMFQIKKLNL